MKAGCICVFVSDLPANLVPSLHRAVVVHFNVIKITAGMVLQVEGVKGQPHEVARGDVDIPSAVCTMGVVGRMGRGGDGARGRAQGRPTA